ncbi:MAG: cyclic nucleotide-binding domain-containing protein [Planctomycetota bacterium]|nr:cyclic nucleotide-binding domain-containing protein [Planctomycetota bacterium]
MTTTLPTGHDLLDRVFPFQVLPLARRHALAERLELRRFLPGELLVRMGETSRDVHLLAQGLVEAIDDRAPNEVISTIEPGHYFGERAPLFDKPRRKTLRARGEVVTYTLPGKDFLEVVDTEPVFAQALAQTLKVKQGVFLGYRKLYARLLGLLDRREFLLSDLLPAYRELSPALHPHLASDRLDLGGLAYAVPRLPEDVTSTCFYYLTADLPALYRDPDEKFAAVVTRARRRAAWRLMPGKLLVLLRDGISDITDFLTCLCLYAVEAKKLRHRLRSSDALLELRRLAADPDPAAAEQFLARAGLSPEERRGLQRVWPRDLARRLHEVLLHHEDVALEVDTQIDNYNSRASETWVAQIRAHVRSLVDLEDPDLDVHIISSNTHSVGNLLSPYLARRRDDLLAWGRRQRTGLCGEASPERPWGHAWACRDDLAYVLARDFLGASDAERAAFEEEGLAGGRHKLPVTAFTGIEVELFDLRRVDPARCDPRLGARRATRPTILVNVDYAFGQQAEEILATLLFLFGRRVRSVNVLGKAGGLVGRRGDLLLPTATLLQTNDELYPLPNHDLPAARLADLAGGIAVHEGPVLTVAGTLLQDRVLLMFYRRIWKAVGLEMEGSFFARQLISAISTGVVSPDVRSRFAYYTSDVPLEPEQNLSEALHPSEGVPPLYAITRAMLQGIFEQVGDPTT